MAVGSVGGVGGGGGDEDLSTKVDDWPINTQEPGGITCAHTHTLSHIHTHTRSISPALQLTSEESLVQPETGGC